MKIGIDARLLERRMTGIGRYIANLVRHLPAVDRQNEYILFSYRPIAGFDAPNMRNVATADIPAEGKLQKIQSAFWVNVTLPRFLAKEKIDVFFSPNSVVPFRKTKTKNVIVVHDVFHLVDPSFHSRSFAAYTSLTIPRAIAKSDLVVTVSESSKRDIVRLLNVPEEKVKVTYLAAEERFMPRTLTAGEANRYRGQYDLPEKFVLYVGVIESRKNIAGIIQIADTLAGRTDVPIVLVGRAGHGGKQYIEEIKRRKNMRYCGFVADEDLPYFYNLASVFLFPSFYEGFGLTPLEAMQSGLPVVASNTSSLPEAVGVGGILLPPTDTNAFVKAILELLKDDSQKDALIRKGLAQARKFNYEKTASETAAILKTL